MKKEWSLILINSENPLPKDFKIKTKRIFRNFEMDKRAACCAKKMLKKAKKDGVGIQVISSYRSRQYQQKLFEKDIKMYESMGMTYEKAYIQTKKYLAAPGESEHNGGLAIDLSTEDSNKLTEDFENTKAFKWLEKNAHNFGFILRYQRGKEKITKINYEPWHYRFVGKKHAKKIKDSGLCLEEYVKLYNN